jgi:hypothetical protein
MQANCISISYFITRAGNGHERIFLFRELAGAKKNISVANGGGRGQTVSCSCFINLFCLK